MCLSPGCSKDDSIDQTASRSGVETTPATESENISAVQGTDIGVLSSVPSEARDTMPVDDVVQYRTAQPDPEINPARLAAAGIHILESKRLLLLTDRDPTTVQGIPALADALYDVLEAQCGELRPSPSGVPFQAVGCLMSDTKRFQTAGLVPNTVLDMRHGEQKGYRFWARDQKTDYYRRHLILHEFVHAYMTIDTIQDDVPNRWFMEGAAEFFATHLDSENPPSFGIIPTSFDGFEGWGRISVIRRRRIDRPTTETELQNFPTLDDVFNENTGQGGEDGAYPWWWAVAWMLSEHPDYSSTWDTLCQCRGTAEFYREITTVMEVHGPRLRSDWLLFVESLTEGFDWNRSFPVHRPVAQSGSTEMMLLADKGWQDTGCAMEQGDTITIECSGECIVEQTTAPWMSQPNGITLEYNQGRPLAEVVAVIVNVDPGWVSRRIAIGDGRILTATQPGRLWLQINDDAGMRSDNSGSYSVVIRKQATGVSAVD